MHLHLCQGHEGGPGHLRLGGAFAQERLIPTGHRMDLGPTHLVFPEGFDQPGLLPGFLGVDRQRQLLLSERWRAFQHADVRLAVVCVF